MTSYRKGSKANRKSRSRSNAGRYFSVNRIYRRLKKGKYADRIDTAAPVFLSAALEYLVVKVLGLAGTVCKDNRRTRITPRHIQLAIRNDPDLNKLLSGVAIAEGGVRPNIRASLLPVRTKY